MSDNLPKPGFVRFKTFEEMSPWEREQYGPGRRRSRSQYQCECEYSPIALFEEEMAGKRCHRDSDD
jgi:hypothetical protein